MHLCALQKNMDRSFFAYLKQLELIAFFSGYALVYCATVAFAGTHLSKKNSKSWLVAYLPLGYALVGTLYLGLQLRTLYPDFSAGHIRLTLDRPYLTAWGVLAMLFWIPFFRRKPVLSLLHSLAFLYFVLRDLILQLVSRSACKDCLSNDMKMYTISMILNLATLSVIFLLAFMISRIKRHRTS